ncbi:alpha-L-fucosidase [Paenibacillus sp. YYML68]|uniref:alpha-L-fucosidase n=1 Tax=Paenibacillus sp. YYML68 TaxID=2909250 RepID=UPI0024909BAC|nr:alpha-L-fucosidase [Paenibacillus sp. YYML68]
MAAYTMQAVHDVISKGPYRDDWESLSAYTIPEWYKNAKFGIFIHWGVYAVPAYGNEWYPREMYLQQKEKRDRQDVSIFDHHIKTYGPQHEFGYKDFIPMFKAERFEPKRWAELFKKAGARYVMPVAEHHDGFQMYNSDLSIWNAVQMGPKRDVIGELKEAIEEHDMVFSVSSHRAEHWWFFDGGMEFPSDVQDEQYRSLYGPAKPRDNGWTIYGHPPDEEFLTDWLLRTCELVDNYRPSIVWFDWWIMNVAFKPYLKKFAAYYYNRAVEWGKEVAINYKLDAYMHGTAVYDVERGQLNGIRPELWQTDTSVARNSWSHSINNSYKDPVELVCDLVDIVSKNGCLLLNVGPKADGTIPEEDEAILLAIGKWLEANGEGIYDTRHWKIYGEGPTQMDEGMHTESKRSPYTTEDIRFTFKNGVLYAYALKLPESGTLTIRALAEGSKHYQSTITSIRLLGDDRELDWSRTAEGLHIELASMTRTPYPVGFRIGMD